MKLYSRLQKKKEEVGFGVLDPNTRKLKKITKYSNLDPAFHSRHLPTTIQFHRLLR